MKLSWFGRLALALFASLTLGLGMTACGGGTIAYLWVLGQQYNQIAGFKVDDYTGNLTQVPNQPFSSGGTLPVMLVIKPGGRYVYVLNQGSYDATTNTQTGDGIVQYSVGGDGTLVQLNIYHSTGKVPQYLQLDSSGGFLYVLDKYSATGAAPGQITAFSIDSTTGRLTLLQNQQSVPPNQPALNYFPVGNNPIMMKTVSGCLFTVNGADQTITPYSVSSATGQLTTTTTGTITTNANNITSINGNGNYVILTDAGTNMIIPYTAASGCSLSSAAGGPFANLAGTSNPVQTLVSTGGTNTFLYVLNYSSTNTTPGNANSSITGYLIQSTGVTPVNGTQIFTVDSGPVCMVEDPTNKYMYISAHNGGTVTGKLFDTATGQLSQLTRGSTFAATGLASCLAISGAVD
jgi:6-phosphogluconolactonase (cycloisomerase 2 family)